METTNEQLDRLRQEFEEQSRELQASMDELRGKPDAILPVDLDELNDVNEAIAAATEVRS